MYISTTPKSAKNPPSKAASIISTGIIRSTPYSSGTRSTASNSTKKSITTNNVRNCVPVMLVVAASILAPMISELL